MNSLVKWRNFSNLGLSLFKAHFVLFHLAAVSPSAVLNESLFLTPHDQCYQIMNYHKLWLNPYSPSALVCFRTLFPPPLTPRGRFNWLWGSLSAREQYGVLLPWQPASMMHVGGKRRCLLSFPPEKDGSHLQPGGRWLWKVEDAHFT